MDLRKYLILLMSVLWVQYFPSLAQPVKFKNYKNNGTDYSYLIKNKGDTSINIQKLWDEIFFTSTNDIINFINKKYSRIDNDYQRAWRFIVDYTWSMGIPLTHEEWYHEPCIFLNSSGFGFCDDKSQVLAQIWEKMGYKSRIWDIKSHVIPEISINGKWELYDPTYACFYNDSLGRILSLEDIKKKPHFFSKPYPHPLRINTYFIRKTGYSSKLLKDYLNESATLTRTTFIDRPVRHNVSLLPKSVVVFPIYSGLPLTKVHYKDTAHSATYANLGIYVPENCTGTIQIPLILHGIRASNAKIRVRKTNTTFDAFNYFDSDGGVEDVISFNGQNDIYTNFSAESYSDIYIDENHEGVWLFFLINPLIVSDVDLISYDSNIEINKIVLPKKYRINVPHLMDVDLNNFNKMTDELFLLLWREIKLYSL